MVVFRPSLPPAIWTIRSMRSPGLGRARFSLWARWIAWVKMGGMAMPAVTTVTLWRRKSRRLSMMASSHQLGLRAGEHQIDGGAATEVQVPLGQAAALVEVLDEHRAALFGQVAVGRQIGPAVHDGLTRIQGAGLHERVQGD